LKVWHCVPCPAVVKNLIVSELTSYSYQHHDTSMDVTTFKKKKPHSLSGKTKITHSVSNGNVNDNFRRQLGQLWTMLFWQTCQNDSYLQFCWFAELTSIMLL